jgi:lipopolysaccharide export system protein LptA
MGFWYNADRVSVIVQFIGLLQKPYRYYVFFLLATVSVYGQKASKVEIVNADSFEFDENLGNGAKRLLGNVQFKQDNVFMYADSAYYYDNNSLDAFGNIRINQSDSVQLFGDFLKYNGNSKMASVTGKLVTLKDKDMTLTTTKLDFNMQSNIGYYNNKGKIVSKENTLTSQNGYYYSNQKNLFFKKDVLLINPDYKMYCDSLRYNTLSETAFFNGPTNIISEANKIYCENGWYNTQKDVAQFNKNAWLKNKEQKLFGDSLFYDSKNGYGKALKNVEVLDSARKLSIKGNMLEYFELAEKSIVTDKAVMIQYFKDDTLYLHADTLKATYDSTYFALKKSKEIEAGKKNKDKKESKVKVQMEDSVAAAHRLIFAHYKVKFFKRDLQGLCDSLVYHASDSLMRLYRKPILWSDANQLTAELINIKLYDGKIFQLRMSNNAFIISRYDSLRFNQIKGKKMIGYFLDNDLRKIDVNGNGETVYYIKDDADGSLTGVNKAECSDMAIYVKDNKVEKLKMFKKPTGIMHPPKEVSPADMQLKDFSWYAAWRPADAADIFVWRPFDDNNKQKKRGKN